METNGHLVAGLGNPGKEYLQTRHNVGFMTIDRLSERLARPLAKTKFDVEYDVLEFAGKNVFLAKPLKFMNNSGHPLCRLARYFHLSCRNMLIIHDDIDLPLGTLKIKAKGGHGGHKGIESIINAFGDNAFRRIRIGIGHPGFKNGVVGHVLGKFSPAEQPIRDRVIQRAGEAAETILCQGEREAMRLYHGALPQNI